MIETVLVFVMLPFWVAGACISKKEPELCEFGPYAVLILISSAIASALIILKV